MNRKIVLGIDLGTTYSCVAYVNEDGRPEVLLNSDEERTTPSVVWFNKNRVVVGNEAKGMAAIYPNDVASFVKRYMGDETYFFECAQGRMRPEEVSSFVLKKLVKDASARLGQTITDVVITCPAYFFVKERNAVQRAGQMAGLNVLQIVNEPTAAAIAYGFSSSNVTQPKNILVYDLGGGTFDVTMIQITANAIDVVCTDGDHRLGGKDWDDAVVMMLIDKFQMETGTSDDLLNIPEALQELQGLAEDAKKQLSKKSEANVRFTYESNTARLTITREEFENATSGLLERTIAFTQSMLQEAKKNGVTRIDEILLVGGSTKMPQVAARLQAEFGFAPKVFEPDEAVAKGAAIIGNNHVIREMLEEKIKSITGDDDFTLDVVSSQKTNDEFTLEGTKREALDAAKQQLEDEGFSLETISGALKTITNVTSKSFGTAAISGLFKQELRLFNLIYRNSKIPTEVTQSFSTMYDNQEIVEFQVLENSADKPTDPKEIRKVAQNGIDLSEGTELWSGDLELPPGLKEGHELLVTFAMDANGLLKVICRDPESGRKIETVLQTGAVISKEEEQEIKRRQAELIVE